MSKSIIHKLPQAVHISMLETELSDMGMAEVVPGCWDACRNCGGWWNHGKTLAKPQENCDFNYFNLKDMDFSWDLSPIYEVWRTNGWIQDTFVYLCCVSLSSAKTSKSMPQGTSWRTLATWPPSPAEPTRPPATWPICWSNRNRRQGQRWKLGVCRSSTWKFYGLRSFSIIFPFFQLR